jgi:hypothetical protein
MRDWLPPRKSRSSRDSRRAVVGLIWQIALELAIVQGDNALILLPPLEALSASD